MTQGPPEPENYSIEDMMERLKKKSSSSSAATDDEGELVIRPDGTQAIRVRKRKRRSKQPVKDREIRERKLRFARIIALVVLLLLAAGALAGGIIYSNSRPFRDALMEKITAATGAEGELRQFRMNPTSANAGSLTLDWPGGSPIESLEVRDLRAETSITSFFGGAFSGDELLGNRGTLTLRVPDASMPARGPATNASPRIDFQRIGIAKLDIMPGDNMAGSFSLREADVSFYPNRGTGGFPQMRLNGGNLRVTNLPELRLDRALVEFRGEEVHLAVARMFHGADELGEFLLIGAFNATDATTTATLDVEASSCIINGIIGDRMARLITGRIDSTAPEGASTLRFPVSDPAAGVLELDFKSSLSAPIQIQGFNFLGDLAVLLNEPWFEQPYFESDVTGTIRRRAGVVEIRDFFAENRNRMAIRGNLSMEPNGRLTGTLDIGVSSALVAVANAPRLAAVLSEASGGYRWVTLRIGGAANAPTDNFMELVKAQPAPNPGGGIDAPAPGRGSSFEDLTRPR